MHWSDVMVESGILGVASAGQFELLGGMGQLEGCVWVCRVWQQGALSLQQLTHSLQQLPETKGQRSLTQAVQLLVRLQKNNHQ